ncbi:MAG: class I SAM-dependent methyltransferase [Pseudomonadota bacterium]|nr:class I SAM-dependent methyltransferase [Pseudomonadota bacterium]
MSNFLVDLIQLYERNGYEVQSSLSPLHFPGLDHAYLPFSYIYLNGTEMCKGGGLAISELTFVDCITSIAEPKNIFVIGNSFGWTTLALGLMCPKSRVVAIDICWRPDEAYGIEVTNKLGRQIEADIRAIKAKSPDNVSEVVKNNFEGGIDLVLIDGGHTPEQQTNDFAACKQVANDKCIYLFHDVINFQMVQSFAKIAEQNEQLISSILFRTPSGMAISYPKEYSEKLSRIVHSFTESDERIKALYEKGRKKNRNN